MIWIHGEVGEWKADQKSIWKKYGGSEEIWKTKKEMEG